MADLGLEAAPDRAIWAQAEATGCVLVTKGEDFARRRAVADSGPAVAWLRVGNTRRAELLRWFPNAFREIVTALDRGEMLVEVRSS